VTERLVVEASIRDELSGPLDDIRDAVHDVGDATEHAGRRVEGMGGRLDRVRGRIRELGSGLRGSERDHARWASAAERAGERVCRAIGRSVGGAITSIKRLGSAAGRMAGPVGIGLGVAAAGAGVFGKQMLDTAARLEAVGNKARVVFGSELPTVTKWAETSASKMGLTRSEATGLAAGFADLLVPMGFARDRATEMSTKTIGLAGALSQWSGGQTSAAEAADILSAAMLGETDGLKGLGIAISAADITARLAAKGQDKLTGAALAQASAIATQELIFSKSTDAQTAYANGGLKVAGTMARLRAGFGELKERSAQALSPYLLRGLTWLLDKMPATSEGIGRIARAMGGPLKDALGSFRESIGDAKGAWSDGPNSLLGSKGKSESFGKMVGTVLGGVIRGLGNLIELASKTASAMTDLFAQAADAGADMLRGLSDVFSALATIPGPWQDEMRTASASLDGAASKLDDIATKADRLNGRSVGFSVRMTADESVKYLLGVPGARKPNGSNTPQPKDVAGFLGGLAGPGTPAGKPKPVPRGGRRYGGAIEEGRWLVGEAGPEVIEVGAPGFVLSNEVLAAMSGSAREAALSRYGRPAGEAGAEVQAGDVIHVGGIHLYGDVTSDVDVERAAERGVKRALKRKAERR
jgi:hypothetical protein